MALADFLKTDLPKHKLQIALEVIRAYKACEDSNDYQSKSFESWTQLENLEDFLEELATEKPLEIVDKPIRHVILKQFTAEDER